MATTTRITAAAFALQMAHLHRECALDGPEVAAWGHRQRELWWQREHTRRLDRDDLARARAALAGEEAAWLAGELT